MKKTVIVGVCFAALHALSTVADATTLSGHLYRIQDITNGSPSYVVASAAESGWPSDAPTPSFWFDCTVTNGWVFTVDADGSNCVAQIPSLVGDGRFLTTNQTLEGTSFSAWKVKPPVFLAADADLGGMPAIDFGKFNSKRGMLFNPVFATANDTATTNTLENIGTVIAVYGSQQGGGNFLAGGYNPLPPSSGYRGRLWDRRRQQIFTTENADTTRVDYPNAIFSGGSDAIKLGIVRHFGLESAPHSSGFNGGWEVITFCATGAVNSATGIGFGQSDGLSYHSGGMRIAEMAFFDTVLDIDTVKKIERHLARKWFERGAAGYNGFTNIEWYRLNTTSASSSGAKATFEVPAGETLRIGKLQGGRKGYGTTPSTVTKTGDGTLVAGDFSKFNGTLALDGGKLAFVKKAVPSLDSLADRLYIRFDASDPGGCETAAENGTNFVAALVNLASGTYKNGTIYARQKSVALRPWLRNGELGRPVLDFGGDAASPSTACGAIMRFTTDTSSDSYTGITIPSVFTVVAVVQANNGGGHVLNNMFQRYTRWSWGAYAWRSDISSASYYATHRAFGLLEKENTYGISGATHLNATNGTAWVNGRKFDSPTLGYETPGWQTVAWRVPGHDLMWLGGESETTVRGRFRLGEILIWLSPLSDEEIMDAQAYLAKKWLGRTLPGYESGEKAGAPEIQHLDVTGAAEVHVPDGATARIGELALNAKTVKTGGGTLYVSAVDSSEYNLVLEGGDVRVVEPLVTNECQIAADPSLHLDASATNHMVLWPLNGTNYVHRWFDEANRNTAFQNAGGGKANFYHYPRLNTWDTLNGMPSIDMGPPHYSWSRTNAYMNLDRVIDSARSVFVVCGAQNGGNYLFGNASPNDGYDKTAGAYLDWSPDSGTTRLNAILASTASKNLLNGEIYVDGVLTNRTANPSGWSLQEYHSLGGVHISSLNMRQDGTYNRGGNRYCEILVYERELSEREKTATRNYLTRKWFPGRALAALPAETPEYPAPVCAYEAQSGATNNVSLAADAHVSALEGDGVVVKDGPGTLSIDDLSGFTGVLSVSSGDVQIAGNPMTNAPVLATSGRILHLDATEGVTLQTAADDGSNVVSRWASVLDDGWDAIPGRHPDSAAKTNMPYYLSHDINGHPGINIFSVSGWNARKCWMRFRKDGSPATLRNIRTVFWVLGSQEGGGVLLGGGRNTNDVQTGRWFRNTDTGLGQSYGYTCREGLIGYLCSAEMKAADLYVNGIKTPSYATPGVLSGGYDIVTFRLQEGVADENAPNADGLAFWTEKADDRGIDGRQRLGELIVYDRVLSEEERMGVESYLRAKWGFSQKSATNAATVCVAAGSTLSTVGSQYIDTLAGPGDVDGSVTVRNFVRDMDGGVMTVDGTVTIADNPSIEILNAHASLRAGDSIEVLSAGAFAGKSALAAAAIRGVPENLGPRAVIRNGSLYIVFRSGLQLLLR